MMDMINMAGKARRLERKITRTVDAAVEGLLGRSERSPIEIVHQVLDCAEQQIQEIGRGRRVFPFTRVRVLVVAEPKDKQTRARFDAVAEGPPSLSARLAERLRASGCATGLVAAEVVYARQRGPDWDDPDFHVEFDRAVTSAAVPAQAPVTAPVARIKLTVVNGAAEKKSYSFTGGRIDIGRRVEVLDARQRLVRTNHVAFAEDGPDANRSVSRKHAHIEYNTGDFNAGAGGYRVWDDRSVHGTSVIRDGRTIKVPAASRGIRLATGDEIALGQARLRVAFI